MYRKKSVDNILAEEKRITIQIPKGLIEVAKSYSGRNLSSVSAVCKLLEDFSSGKITQTEESNAAGAIAPENNFLLYPEEQQEFTRAYGCSPSQWKFVLRKLIWQTIERASNVNTVESKNTVSYSPTDFY